MRFLADMGISPYAVEFLRKLGHDAVHLTEQGLQRLPDEEILKKARLETRVLLTSDLDFGYLVAVGGHVLPSVVLFRLSDMRPASVCTCIQTIVSQFQTELDGGAVIVVRETGVRIRRLPIGEETDK